ncbi:MAG: cytochrome c biogenesis protein CcsA [candidate division WOR-3 bacterium]|nr:MAG: cytochrome c biogenesis protein CcsA [candidate division WOR-3 bacterium]
MVLNRPAVLVLVLCCYAGAGLVALASCIRPKGVFRWLGIALSGAGALLQVGFVLCRTNMNGFLPFASRFESMTLFALTVHLSGLMLYLATKRSSVKAVTDAFSIALLGAALFAVGFNRGGHLNPMLNSPWFAFHILTAFAGYGAMTAGLGWSLAAVWVRGQTDSPVPRRLAGSAALLLGAGILAGAFWADVSWGAYWSWDPKETWALLTWLVLVVYLHLSGPIRKRWLDLAAFGLATGAMLFTFIGINILKWGMHRY